MRILKLGNQPEKPSKYAPIRLTCSTCNSVLEVVQEDIRYIIGQNEFGFICPVCEDFITTTIVAM